MLGFAAYRPDTDDPPADHPGAKKTYWRSARSEFPGVSEFFVDELGAVLAVGRGTAAQKAARAFTWRHGLPATFTALKRGDIDERRAHPGRPARTHLSRPGPPGGAGGAARG